MRRRSSHAAAQPARKLQAQALYEAVPQEAEVLWRQRAQVRGALYEHELEGMSPQEWVGGLALHWRAAAAQWRWALRSPRVAAARLQAFQRAAQAECARAAAAVVRRRDASRPSWPAGFWTTPDWAHVGLREALREIEIHGEAAAGAAGSGDRAQCCDGHAWAAARDNRRFYAGGKRASLRDSRRAVRRRHADLTAETPRERAERLSVGRQRRWMRRHRQKLARPEAAFKRWLQGVQERRSTKTSRARDAAFAERVRLGYDRTERARMLRRERQRVERDGPLTEREQRARQAEAARHAASWQQADERRLAAFQARRTAQQAQQQTRRARQENEERQQQQRREAEDERLQRLFAGTDRGWADVDAGPDQGHAVARRRWLEARQARLRQERSAHVAAAETVQRVGGAMRTLRAQALAGAPYLAGQGRIRPRGPPQRWAAPVGRDDFIHYDTG